MKPWVFFYHHLVIDKDLKECGKNSFPRQRKLKLTDEQKEIDSLKKQSKDISEEREILKKIMRVFSKSDK